MANCLTDLGRYCSPSKASWSWLSSASARASRCARSSTSAGGWLNSLNKLGEVAYRRRQYHAAKRNYQESLAILRDFGERERLASTLMLYGEVCTALEEKDAALNKLGSNHCASPGRSGWIAPRRNRCWDWRCCWPKTEAAEQLIEILAGIIEHPSFDQADKEKVANLLAGLQAGLAPQVYQASLEAGKVKIVG